MECGVRGAKVLRVKCSEVLGSTVLCASFAVQSSTGNYSVQAL